MASTFVTQCFGLLIVALYVSLLVWLARVGRMRPLPGLGGGIALAAWLSTTSLQAPVDAPMSFEALLLWMSVGVIGALFAAFSPAVGEVLDRTSGAWLVGFQGARLALALVLWRLAAEGLWQERVAAMGMGLDVVTGALAPLVALLAFQDRVLSTRWILAFHGLGLALLGVVAGEALLAAVATQGSAVTTTPFVWLPTFAVPLFLFAHVASLRQLSRQRALATPPVASRG